MPVRFKYHNLIGTAWVAVFFIAALDLVLFSIGYAIY
jgi:hypothetical protein